MLNPHTSTGRIAEVSRRVLNRLARSVDYDQRFHFRDLAFIDPNQRTARSPVVQFYSSVHNIGNYLPVMGIQKMLGFPTDTWHANKSLIDFDFINQHYELAIIGGAGLLHGAYEGFWDVVHEKCEIPIVVWGVGGCYPDDDDSPAVPPSVASPVLQNAAWVNLRDTYTADFYDVPKATISACPTVVYLDDSWAKDAKRSKNLLLSTHTGLVDSREKCHRAEGSVGCTRIKPELYSY